METIFRDQLPDKWCIEVSKHNVHYLNRYLHDNSKDYKGYLETWQINEKHIGFYFLSTNAINGVILHPFSFYGISRDFDKITTKEFLEYYGDPETRYLIKSNKLIAQFTGSMLMYHLEIHKSMDLMMNVIEKIESLPTDKENGDQYQFNTSADGISITRYDDGSGVIASRVNEIGKCKRRSTFEVIVEFIKFYNNLKKT